MKPMRPRRRRCALCRSLLVGDACVACEFVTIAERVYAQLARDAARTTRCVIALVCLLALPARAVDYDLRFTTVGPAGVVSYSGYVRIPPTPWPTGVLLSEQPDPTPGIVHAPLAVVAPPGAPLEFMVSGTDGTQTGFSNVCSAVMVTHTATVTQTASPTRTATATLTTTATATRTVTATATRTNPSTPTRTTIPTPGLLRCDLNGDGKVTWLEWVRCRFG